MHHVGLLSSSLDFTSTMAEGKAPRGASTSPLPPHWVVVVGGVSSGLWQSYCLHSPVAVAMHIFTRYTDVTQLPGQACQQADRGPGSASCRGRRSLRE